MDPVWTLRGENSFLLSDLLGYNVSSNGKFFAKVKISHHTSHLISLNKKVIFLSDFLVRAASFLSLRIQPFLPASYR